MTSARDGTLGLVSLRVSWERRAASEDCDAGTRSVSLEQTVSVDPGKTEVIRGDGGLTITLRHR